ncbi:SLC13 family permease [Petroclostridium sp. X23]|uniref:SLC13 family permease n=1 Tax=Petroclostridium sp. X23 TaxID=3045146 RepID=UPI0024AD3279|nr:SLC13 family permease [Petroclostridium sp. X23]WHH61136.1 hypothetical protein QKW49_10690 [Petroclostridium sp. X23]
MSLSVIFLICILSAIFLGFFLKVNAGIISTVLAVLLGVLGCGLSVSGVIALWPSKLMMTLVFMTFFFGFAINNGTLHRIIQVATRWGRKCPPLIPIILFAINFIMSMIGVPAYAMFAFTAPIIIPICVDSSISLILAAIIIIGAPIAGGYSSVGQFGIITTNTMLAHGYSMEQAIPIVRTMWINNIIVQVLVFVAFYFILKGYKTKVSESVMHPDPFDKVQKKTAILLMVAFGSMILMSVLKTLIGGDFFITLNKFNDVLFIIPILIIASIILKVGDEKEAFKRIPMGSILLVCGIITLVSVGLKGGILDEITVWAADNVSSGVAPYFLCVAASFMSYFVSTTSGVIPTLGTMVAGIAQSTGLNTCLLYSCISVPAGFTGYSPFSSGGSITLGSIVDDNLSKPLYKTLLWFPLLATVINILCIMLGIMQKGPF